ncbi:hypothetical protein CPB83DRAFT_844492 [Crepidotus variabilis]|uniref:F-box domain-containing protein n=1 Tax=Crepidotus variabilis TaxID=179855 RepID=A0A9P6ER83_9AGAR|nr:hypothetical protein CPB83DRAFT_844492 [Crepidotus variabilis]
MSRDALQQSIQTLKVKRDNLVKELEAVELDLRNQQAAYSSLLNEESLIYRLPAEIITSVFLICQHWRTVSRPSSRRRTASVWFPIIASHVSRKWRQLALGTPLLWNVIDLPVYLPPDIHDQHIMDRVRAHLERSGECFLDITLEFRSGAGTKPTRLLELLKDNSNRWRRLSVVTPIDFVADFRVMLQDANAPSLEHLSLHFGKPQEPTLSPRKRLENVTASILQIHSSPLTFVRLAGLALGNLHPPMAGVTTLHLDGWTRHYGSYGQFRAILEAASSLVNLSLNELCIHHPRDPLAIIQPTSLPYLQSLRIRGSSTPVSFLLSLLDTRKLRHLSLHNIDSFSSGILATVETLQLDSCALNEQDIAHLIQSLPAIFHLTVDEAMPDIFFMLLPDWTDGDTAAVNASLGKPLPWPNLRTLALRELQPSDVPLLFQMISLRQEYSKLGCGCSLGKVTLDRRSRTVLRTKQRLMTLQEQIKVENVDDPEAWPPGLGYNDVHDLLE